MSPYKGSLRIATNKVSRGVITANHVLRWLLEDGPTPTIRDSARDLLAAFPNNLGEMTGARRETRLIIYTGDLSEKDPVALGMKSELTVILG